MKNLVRSMAVMVLFSVILSCTKDDLPRTDASCYSCAVDTESIDVCLKDDGDFLVDGETVANPNNATLKEYIDAIEANPNNDPSLEGISCSIKQ